MDGLFLGPGVECPQFRPDGEDGQISLEMAGKALPQPGDRLRLEGHFLRVSRCMQGRGFRVTAIEILNR